MRFQPAQQRSRSGPVAASASAPAPASGNGNGCGNGSGCGRGRGPWRGRSSEPPLHSSCRVGAGPCWRSWHRCAAADERTVGSGGHCLPRGSADRRRSPRAARTTRLQARSSQWTKTSENAEKMPRASGHKACARIARTRVKATLPGQEERPPGHKATEIEKRTLTIAAQTRRSAQSGKHWQQCSPDALTGAKPQAWQGPEP